jgi:hypothetical protein
VDREQARERPARGPHGLGEQTEPQRIQPGAAGGGERQPSEETARRERGDDAVGDAPRIIPRAGVRGADLPERFLEAKPLRVADWFEIGE